MKRGFTLAEMLIAIAVIGIVAAMTLPTLITNIQKQVQASKIEVFEKKLAQGADLLNINNGIGPYYGTTLDFINALSKHMKLAYICDKEHLTNCFPYSYINTDNGNFSINDIKNGDSFMIEENGYKDTAGFIMANGMPMILSWNTQCPISDPDQITSKNFSTTGCIKGIYDINGSKGPNKFKEDVLPFSITGLQECAVKINGKCFTAPMAITPLSNAECLRRKTELNLDYCSNGDDYYAGAAAMCGGKSNLPSQSDLLTLAKDFYNYESIKSGNTQTNLPAGKKFSNGDFINKIKEYGFINNNTSSDPFVVLYANTEVSNTYAQYRYYTPDKTKFNSDGCCRARTANDKQVICKGKSSK